MKLTDEAVEAAARSVHHERYPWVVWENLKPESREYYRNEVRGPIEAALPHLTDDGAALPVRRDGDDLAAAPSSPHPTYSEIKDAIRTGLGVRGRVDGCGCESHICSAADGIQALFGEGTTPAIDREALAKALHDAACGCDHYGHMIEIADREAAELALALIAGAS